jgi:hypothetical protein
MYEMTVVKVHADVRDFSLDSKEQYVAGPKLAPVDWFRVKPQS